jgi:hypothetical protein
MGRLRPRFAGRSRLSQAIDDLTLSSKNDCSLWRNLDAASAIRLSERSGKPWRLKKSCSLPGILKPAPVNFSDFTQVEK